MLKVGYYIGPVSLDRGGVSTYSNRVLRSLCRDQLEKCGIELVVYGGEEVSDFESVSIDGGNVHNLEKLWKSEQLDLIHFPSQTPPVPIRAIRFTVTMHDVQELHFPEYFTPEQRRERAIRYLFSLNESNGVAVSFDHIKADIHRYFEIPSEKVEVLSLPYNRCRIEEEARIAEADLPFIEPEQEAKGFILYPAQTWEHKNHLRLISAFENACRKVPGEFSLICTGKRYEPYFEQIRRVLSGSDFKDRIKFTGIVDPGTLRWLYENATAVMIPSLYEAGSLPLVEAMTHGAAVACGRTTSLPNTIGKDEFVFDAQETDSIASMMIRLLEDPSFRFSSKENSKKRIKELTIDGDEGLSRRYADFWNRSFKEGQRKLTCNPNLANWLVKGEESQSDGLANPEERQNGKVGATHGLGRSIRTNLVRFFLRYGKGK